MFFIGAFYASVSILLVNWIFSQDAILKEVSGILVVSFTVMFSIPFVYYMFKLEESRASGNLGAFGRIKEHRRAIWAFLWLFLGFVIGYAFWFMILPTTVPFAQQIGTYCNINNPGATDECAAQFGLKENVGPTVFLTEPERLFLIFTNNIYVLIFTLIFSLLFGAGVIFILAWNASVIAAAIGIFSQSELASLPIGLLRYMIHGIPEIAAYFVAALAGGIISIAVVRHEIGTEKFWDILQDSLNLIILAVVILFVAAVMEVFITPVFFA